MSNENLVIQKINGNTLYCRTVSNQRLQLEKDILVLYGQYNNFYVSALVLPSGMTTIAALFHTVHLKNRKACVVLGNELYCDTPKIATEIFGQSDVITVDITNNKAIIELFSEKGRKIILFFIESCSNPSGYIFDFALIPQLRLLQPACIFTIDNTWLTAIGFNPFTWGCDIVVESMTKYISGGNCIGGLMIGQLGIVGEVQRWARRYGQYVGSDHCEIFSLGLSTLKKRMANISTYTAKMNKWLCKVMANVDAKKNIKIMYPENTDHPSYKSFKEYIQEGYRPGCIWIGISTIKSKNQCTKILEKYFDTKLESESVLKYETSYGAAYSKIDNYPKLMDGYLWMRLSIGYALDNDKYVEIKRMINELIHMF